MSKQRLTNITQNERQNKGVVALADRPNVVSAYGKGGLSPLELKVWFDKLGNLMADKINEIQDALNDNGQNYIGISNLGESIECLGDLTASFLNGSFATLLLAYHSAADMGDTDNLATLQAVINEKARLISVLREEFESYKTLIKSNAGAAEVGVSDSYDGSGKKLSNLIADIANGTLAAKLTFQCYGFATSNKATATSKTLNVFADAVADALQGDISSGLLEKIADRYTKTETDNLLDLKVDESTYTAAQNTQDGRLTSLESRTTDIEGNIGNMSNITPIAADVALAIKSLNEDIDSLQLGVIPRIIRGVVLWATPETLDADLIAQLNAKVLESTGRNAANNSDSVQVWDNAMPDAGKIYTYHYWSSEVIGSELDGWYLASIYMSPAITDIPSYVLNVIPSTWSATADSDGLYYISADAITHGMGSDMSLYVDLRRETADGDFAPCNQFYVSPTGTVICYTDEKFDGKLIVRVGKAYYTTNTTNIVTIEMEQVNGLDDALDAKVELDGGEVGDTITTFPDVSGTAENLTSGSTVKSLFGKIKNWLGRLKALAFKDTVSNADVAAAAAIEQSKIDGLSDALAAKATAANLTAHTGNTSNPHSVTKAQVGLGSVDNTADTAKPVSTAQQTALNDKVTAAGGEVGACISALTEDTAATRTNLSGGDTIKVQLGKIKRWFAALGSLAFKSKTAAGDYTAGSIVNADISASAAIGISKLDLTTIRNLLYPVGSIKMTTVNTNPSTYLGGTWAAWGSGRVPVGVDTAQAEFDTVEATGGEKAHALTENEMPTHSHTLSERKITTETVSADAVVTGATKAAEGDRLNASTSSVGGNTAHNNLQPFITCYMWKRTE